MALTVLSVLLSIKGNAKYYFHEENYYSTKYYIMIASRNVNVSLSELYKIV